MYISDILLYTYTYWMTCWETLIILIIWYSIVTGEIQTVRQSLFPADSFSRRGTHTNNAQRWRCSGRKSHFAFAAKARRERSKVGWFGRTRGTQLLRKTPHWCFNETSKFQTEKHTFDLEWGVSWTFLFPDFTENQELCSNMLQAKTDLHGYEHDMNMNDPCFMTMDYGL